MTKNIMPQHGPQEAFLSSSADIAIYGGAAGSGKTYCLLMEPLRHVSHKGFGAVTFRRTSVQVRNVGGLWHTSMDMYSHVGGSPKETFLTWNFPAGTTFKFAHLEYDKTVLDWQGSEISLIGFDELTHFSEYQFWYMLSRNRSTCGVKPYVRATCNPDASHFLVVGPQGWGSGLISWWIDEDGYPIPERSGVIRWFVRYNDVLKFADTKEELIELYPELIPKSLTFIPSKLSDNKILEEADPGYRANLMALSSVERSRLLDGNWKVQPASGMYFKREWFTDKFIQRAPSGIMTVRAWDLAATEVTPTSTNPDWTGGLKMGVKGGIYYIMDLRSGRLNSLGVENLVKTTAQSDGMPVHIVIEQEPGGSGKSQIEHFQRNVLTGYKLEGVTSTNKKEVRAQAVSAAIEAGKVMIVSGEWNHALFDQLEPFPDPKVHDDFVDALSSAFNYLSQHASGNYAGFDSPSTKTSVPSFGGRRGQLPGL